MLANPPAYLCLRGGNEHWPGCRVHPAIHPRNGINRRSVRKSCNFIGCLQPSGAFVAAVQRSVLARGARKRSLWGDEATHGETMLRDTNRSDRGFLAVAPALIRVRESLARHKKLSASRSISPARRGGLGPSAFLPRRLLVAWPSANRLGDRTQQQATVCWTAISGQFAPEPQRALP